MKKGFLIAFILLASAVVACSVFLSLYSSQNDFYSEEKQSLHGQSLNINKEPVLYSPKYVFYNFTDPNEGAFSMLIPENWEVSNDSGLVRPYSYAGIMISAFSKNNSGFFLLSPYSVATPLTTKLSLEGFKEGDFYNLTILKNYTPAREFLIEYLNELNQKVELIDLVDRPDLIQRYPSNPISKQSAAEMTYVLDQGEMETTHKIVVYTYLDDLSGKWSSQLSNYYAPNEKFDEAEYLIFKSLNSFNVSSAWAISESNQLNKTKNKAFVNPASVAYTLSSVLDYKSISMDRVNNQWAKAILGINEVLDPLTGENWIVEANSTFYWRDNKGNIYGTDIGENPFPETDTRLLQIQI